MTLPLRPKGLTMTEAHVYDVHGALIDVTSVRYLVEHEKLDLNAFHAVIGDYPPNQGVVDEMKRSRVSQKVIVVMTDVSEKFRSLVITWLRHHQVPFDLLLMRPNQDFRKDVVVKAEMLRQTQLRGFVVTHAWSDNPRTVDLWKRENIPVIVVPG